MLPFGIGASEVILILVVVLLVMGPGKLPEIARLMGRGVRLLRRAGQELKDAIDIEDEVARIRSWEASEEGSETAEVVSVEDGSAGDGYHDEYGHYHPGQPVGDEASEASEPEVPFQGPVKREEGTVVRRPVRDEPMEVATPDVETAEVEADGVPEPSHEKDTQG